MGIVVFLFFGLIILIAISVPIAFAIGASSFLALYQLDLGFYLIPQRMFSNLNNFILMAIPMFLFTGLCMNKSGITKKLINFSAALVGPLRGGLNYVNILVSMFFAGISGSSTADAAGIGSILIPSMTEKGYPKALSVSITAVSSTIGNIIPPSLIAIIYANIVGVSVGEVFIAGILPGILFGLFQSIISYYYSVKYNLPKERRVSFREFLSATKEAIPPLIAPVIILGGIFTGFFTATEAAGIAALYSIILGFFFYKTLKWHDIWQLLIETGKMSSTILLCIGLANIFGYVLGYIRTPQLFGNIILSFTQNPTLILFMVTGVFLLTGCFMGAAPAIIIFMPVFSPIAEMFGIDPIHLAVVAIVTLALGLITPPFGLSLLIACKIAGIPIEKTFSILSVLFLAMVCVIVLIILFPDVVLFLPRIFYQRI